MDGQRGAQNGSNGAYGYAARGVRVGEPFQPSTVDYQGSAAVRGVTGVQRHFFASPELLQLVVCNPLDRSI
jgi:hypothetical protein